jgi:hypothetical protein
MYSLSVIIHLAVFPGECVAVVLQMGWRLQVELKNRAHKVVKVSSLQVDANSTRTLNSVLDIFSASLGARSASGFEFNRRKTPDRWSAYQSVSVSCQ